MNKLSFLIWHIYNEHKIYFKKIYDIDPFFIKVPFGEQHRLVCPLDLEILEVLYSILRGVVWAFFQNGSVGWIQVLPSVCATEFVF